MGEAVLVHLLNEMPQHLLSDVEVGDDTVVEGTDGGDRSGRPTQHALRLDADRVHLARALVDSDDRRLGEHNAAATDVDERIRGAEVDGHIAAAETGKGIEPAHQRLSSLAGYCEKVRP